MKYDQSSGAFRIQRRGESKWTSLRSRAVMYWGEGYDLTREQAARVARSELARYRREDPASEYRIWPSA